MHLVEGSCMVLGRRATYAGATDVGRVRQCNEDSLLLLPEAGVFAVADGLGGLDAGDLASSIALARLHDLCRADIEDGSDPATRLHTMVAAVNLHTYEQRVALGKNMATTLALVRFTGQAALVAHVGDSRIYRWRDQHLTRITSDHSLVNELCDQGTLTEDQARNSPQRHVITRAIGAGPEVCPSIRPLSLAAGDLLLLCTDGLHGMVTDEALATLFESEGADSSRLAEQLVTVANRAGGHDNITVIVLALQ